MSRGALNKSGFAVIEAPSILGLFPKGVETLPDALLAAGLADRLDARRAGRVEAPPYDRRRDPETGLLNPQGLARYSVALANAIEPALEQGEFYRATLRYGPRRRPEWPHAALILMGAAGAIAGLKCC